MQRSKDIDIDNKPASILRLGDLYPNNPRLEGLREDTCFIKKKILYTGLDRHNALESHLKLFPGFWACLFTYTFFCLFFYLCDELSSFGIKYVFDHFTKIKRSSTKTKKKGVYSIILSLIPCKHLQRNSLFLKIKNYYFSLFIVEFEYEVYSWAPV